MKRIKAFIFCSFFVIISLAQTHIIAHRGYHEYEGAVHNSLLALKSAQDLGVWGAECDVNETKDGKLVVIHGPFHGIYNIQRTDFAKLRAHTLKNGEKLPTLDEYLQQVAASQQTKLIIEIKNHATPQQETRVVKKILKAVKKRHLENQVEYIAFHSHVCNELVKFAPKGSKIAYLNGDFSPEYCKALGYTGIDYHIGLLKKKSQWIDEAKKMGLTVNVWTVNSDKDLQWCIDHDVDYITTDHPVKALDLVSKQKK